MIVPGVNAAGAAPSMLRNVLPRPTVAQSEFPDAGYIRVTGPKGCADCTSQVWNADADSRRNLAGFASLGRGLAGRGLGLVTPYDQLSPTARLVLGTLQVASVAASGYHGYKANNGSVGWMLWWGLCGAVAPIITPVVAVARGYGHRYGARGTRGLGRGRRRRARR